MAGHDLGEYSPTLDGEVLDTDRDYLAVVFENSGIKEALAAYLDGDSEIGDEEVEALLQRFAGTVAETAWNDGDVNVDLVRFSFDELRTAMDETASEAYGYERPRTTFRAILNHMGIARVTQRYIAPLDERYWSKQFMEEFADGHLPFTPRGEGETDEHYWPRYVYSAMHGHVFTPYTYLV